jgi:hypothetical protein
MTLPSGRSPVQYRLDLTESEFAFHIDKLVPLRLTAIGSRLGGPEKAMTSVRLMEVGAFVRSSLPATPPRRPGDRVD